MVFTYLPRAVANGPNDEEAREKMANAASIAGITLGNSQVALAHALGHSAGALFKNIPHGRITAIFLPYTIEFVANGGLGRYADLVAMIGQPVSDEAEAAQKLASATRNLMRQLNLPTTLQEAGITPDQLENRMETLCEHVVIDTNTLMSRRIPEMDEVEKLFQYAFDGRSVDF
jgi:acetaldehyde dehydrogenase/alcohol dehydrogenase